MIRIKLNSRRKCFYGRYEKRTRKRRITQSNMVNSRRKGSVDGWDFKQYILGIMFYRYISENITNYINEGGSREEAGDIKF